MAVSNTNNTTNAPSFSYLQAKNKIGGLVSGMDINSVMEKLMKAESSQMEKLQQQKQKYEWKRDSYRDVNLKLSTFEKSAFTDYGLKSAWNAKTVSASNSSVSGVATATASGSLTISEAELATAGQKIVAMPTSTIDNSQITANSTMASMGVGQNGSFTIKAINEKGTYTEKTIEFKTTDKVSDVMSRINMSGVGVTALVSGNQLSLTANTEGTGAEGSINVTSDSEGVFQKLGLLSGNTGDVTAGATEGKNGYIVANGVKIEGTSNKYSISGYQLTINKQIQTTDVPSKITSTVDSSKVVDKVKAFVKSYNDLIADISKRTSEKKNISYQPLTEAQKSEMNEEEIVKWEEKAKAGLLRGDSSLNKVISNMRSTLSNFGSTGSGSTDMLSKIGITTSKTWSEGGKLELDEDKLLKALESDPEVVSRIFTDDSTTGSVGIIDKLRKTAQEAVNSIKKTAGSTESVSESTYSLGSSILSIDDKIDSWKDRLKRIEERYWSQFSTMETAVQKANSQSSIFAG